MSVLLSAANELAGPWAAAVWRACWQGGAAILVVWVACRAWPGMPASARCWLWRLAYARLLVSLLWFRPVGVPVLPVPSAVPMVAPAHDTPAGVHQGVGRRVGSGPPAAALADGRLTPAAAPTPDPPPHSRGLLRWLLLAWIGAGAWGIARLASGWRAVSRLRRSCSPAPDGALRDLAGRMARQFGLNATPSLLLGHQVGSPLLTGIVRPAILLPAGLPSECSPGDLRHLLAHEMAHLRRRDLLWSWLPAPAHALFAFHPLVWLARRELRLAQEMACDEMAIRVTEAPAPAYAQALVNVAAWAGPEAGGILAVGVAESYQTLRQRLAALAHSCHVSPRRAAVAAAVVAAAGLLGVVPWRLVARPATAAAPGTAAVPSGAAAVTPLARGVDTRVLSFEGRVTDEAGRPVAGATVYLLDAQWDGERLVGKQITSADGSYRFAPARFATGERDGVIFSLIALHPRHGISGLQYIRSTVPLPRAARTVVHAPPLVLPRPAVLVGRAVDTAGRPVAGAIAQVSNASLTRAPVARAVRIPSLLRGRFQSRSDPYGRFRIAGLPQKARLMLHVAAPGRASYWSWVWMPPVRESAPVRAVLRPGGEIHGTVRYGATGRPAAGVRVAAQAQDRSAFGAAVPVGVAQFGEAVTDAAGRYRIAGLYPAQWNVLARLEGPEPTPWTVAAAEGVRTRAGRPTRGVDLRLVRGTLLTVGALNGKTGKPVPGVEVGYYGAARPQSSAAALMTETGPDGRACFRVPPGRAYLYLAGTALGWYPRPGEQDVSTTVSIGRASAQVATLRLSPLAAVQGRVLGPDGRPAAGARLQWARRTNAVFVGTADARGRYCIQGFRAGDDVTLGAQADGMATPDWTTVQAGENDPPYVELQLQRYDGATLVGRAVDPSGRPVADARIAVAREREGVRRSQDTVGLPQITDALGRYTVRDVWARWRYIVHANKHPDDKGEGVPVVARGESAPVLARKGQVNRVPDIVMRPIARR